MNLKVRLSKRAIAPLAGGIVIMQIVGCGGGALHLQDYGRDLLFTLLNLAWIQDLQDQVMNSRQPNRPRARQFQVRKAHKANKDCRVYRVLLVSKAPQVNPARSVQTATEVRRDQGDQLDRREDRTILSSTYSSTTFSPMPTTSPAHW